jgi:large-conductance mechanosensitive channel
MKIVRFVKKLWADLLDESHELKVFFEYFWSHVIAFGIIGVVCYLVGKLVELVGLAKYFPKDADGKEAGPLMYGILIVAGFIIISLLVFCVISAFQKFKKTWKEV